MVHSKRCILNGLDSVKLTELGECPYDQGGYFIINGNEKVCVSQEKIAERVVVLRLAFAEEHFSRNLLEIVHLVVLNSVIGVQFLGNKFLLQLLCHSSHRFTSFLSPF